MKPGASIAEALTQMQLNDYSQLVVATNERNVKGVVSYHSIATAQLLGPPVLASEWSAADRSLSRSPTRRDR